MNLILGGTGDLGTAVVRRLLAAGDPVRVMTRRPGGPRAVELAGAGAEVVEGDLLDLGSLERACAGATAVLSAAHSLRGRGRSASRHVDGRAHRRLVDVAAAAGVGRFVYTSVYDFGPAYRAVPFFRIKYEVEAYLKSSGLAWTVLRPTAFMEYHAHMLIGQAVAEKGKVTLLGRGERLRNFVAADDVARVAVRALRDPVLVGQTLSIGGPRHHTNMDVVRAYEAATGRQAKVTRVPLAPLRALSVLTRPFHPGLSQVLQLAVLNDLHDQRYEGLPGPTPLEEWVARKLGRAAVAGGAG